jgi:hypothetical protein
VLLTGDNLIELKKLPADSIDLLCTDPPYGYSFMGKDWDKAVPSVELWRECLRVLKPGAFAFIMSAPRSDVLSRMIVRVEDAGFRVDFTPIFWTYASGFPKAANIGKMVDKRNGTDRELVAVGSSGKTRNVLGAALSPDTFGGDYQITKGTSPLEGSYGGFQPKPAVEVIIVAMKPLSEKTFVDQALKNGKGVTWLDGCRVSGVVTTNPIIRAAPGFRSNGLADQGATEQGTESSGRFPANLVVSDEILGDHSRFFKLPENVRKTFPFLIVPKASKVEKNAGTDLTKGRYQDDTRVDKTAIGANKRGFLLTRAAALQEIRASRSSRSPRSGCGTCSPRSHLW